MELKYNIDDKPKLWNNLLYGLQWFMICIPVVITATFIAPPGETVFYTQKLFAVMGIVMLCQAFLGHRLPLIAGPAAVLIMGVLCAQGQGYDSSTIYSSLAVGGVFLLLLAVSGLLAKIQKLFTIRIVISILILISLTMAKPILGLLYSDEYPHIATIFLISFLLLMVIANNLFKGIWKTTTVVWAMIIGSAIYYCITGFPEQLTTDTVSSHLFVEKLNIDLGLVISFIFCYIALLINEVGSIQSLGEMIEAPKMEKRNLLGVIITGIGNIFSGALGILGPVDYSLSPGVVASTQCASRYTIIPAAVAMIVLSFFPSVVALLLTVPGPVMGTVLLFLMCTQMSAGFNMMKSTNAVITFRDGMVLAVPVLFNVLLTFAPASALERVPEILKPIVGNSFVMGIILILILEHIVLREKK